MFQIVTKKLGLNLMLAEVVSMAVDDDVADELLLFLFFFILFIIITIHLLRTDYSVIVLFST